MSPHREALLPRGDLEEEGGPLQEAGGDLLLLGEGHLLEGGPLPPLADQGAPDLDLEGAAIAGPGPTLPTL